MDDLTRLLEDDLQASQPEVRLGLSRAGVMGVSKAIRISYGGIEQQIAADIECTVDLDPSQKGVHMSRFPELFEEAIEEVVIGEAFLIEVLAEHIAAHIVERQQALRADVHISARYPIERTTPVTGLPTQEMVEADRDRGGLERVECGGSSASRRRGSTPVRARRASCAAERASDCSRPGSTTGTSSGSSSSSRSQRTISAGAGRSTSAPRRASTPSSWSEIVEGSMSAPVYELLKRPDELFVVEHAHLQPRFVEDSVRLALKGMLDAYPELDDSDFVFSRQVNLETIHTHDVLAERFGTVGELRRELEHGGPLEHHTGLDEWLSRADLVTVCY